MTRIGAPAITDEYGERFGAAWGVVSDQVAHRLRQKGFDPSAADDALQEAAARALARRVAFADADDLARWVWTVAWRSAIDASRRHRLHRHGRRRRVGIRDHRSGPARPDERSGPGAASIDGCQPRRTYGRPAPSAAGDGGHDRGGPGADVDRCAGTACAVRAGERP